MLIELKIALRTSIASNYLSFVSSTKCKKLINAFLKCNTSSESGLLFKQISKIAYKFIVIPPFNNLFLCTTFSWIIKSKSGFILNNYIIIEHLNYYLFMLIIKNTNS